MEKYTRKKYSAGGINWQKYPTKNVRGLYEIKGDEIDSKVNIVSFERYDDDLYSLYPLEKDRHLFKEILVKSNALNSLDKGISVKGETNNGKKVSIKRLGTQDFSYKKGGLLTPSQRYVQEIKGLTGLTQSAIENYISENKLTNDEVLNIVIGLGRKQIERSNVSTAMIGKINNAESKKLLAFAKSKKAFSYVVGGGIFSDAFTGYTGTHYTGLVGETNAISSGEMFADGGGVGDKKYHMIIQKEDNYIYIKMYDKLNDRKDYENKLQELLMDITNYGDIDVVVYETTKEIDTKEKFEKYFKNLQKELNEYADGGLFGLKGNQYKIDMNKNGKLDAEDFKILRYKRKKYSDGGALSSGSINYLTDLWFAVQQKDTDDYKMLSENLDKLNVPYFIQNEVSADAETQRGRKALNIPEVHDRIKKIVEKNGKMFSKGGAFERLSNRVAKEYVGDAVAPKYQRMYGKRYSKEEAKEVGNKVAGKVKAMQITNKKALGGNFGKIYIVEYIINGNKHISEYLLYDNERIENKLPSIAKIISIKEKKAFGGLFGKNIPSISKQHYPNFEDKQVMLKSGEWVQVLDQSGDTLMVMDLGKLGTGAVPKRVNISEVDMSSFMSGGSVKTKLTLYKSNYLSTPNKQVLVSEDGNKVYIYENEILYDSPDGKTKGASHRMSKIQLNILPLK